MKTIVKENFPQEVDTLAGILEEILQKYSNPSFGSSSKRDIDILLFSALQDLGIIEPNPQIYDVVQLLHITRAKARNLIYESALRQRTINDMEAHLEDELKRLIIKPIFLREGDKVCIEIDNPLITDYIRHRLRNLNHITDGSFSPELVKMTSAAFSDLYASLLPEESINQIKDKFVALGLERDKSAKAIICMVLKAIGKVALGKVGEELAEYTVNVTSELGNWMKGVFDNIPANKDALHGTIFQGANFA